MRDWTRTLPNASFRGAPFFVDEERLGDSGREVAIHRFVKAESHATEDMRAKPKTWSLEAYLVGDTADADVQAFVAICSQAGDGVLVMPVLGTQLVKCLKCSASSHKDKLGYVKLDLEFVESGNDSAFASIAIGDRIAANLMDTMAGVISITISAFTG